MWIPAGFRFTCYYYRGAYYKAFWLDPVASPSASRARATSASAICRSFCKTSIAISSTSHWSSSSFSVATRLIRSGSRTRTERPISAVAIGSLVLIVNVVLLAGYTLGCHSLRHLVGGFLDSKSKASACASCYNAVTCLNQKHMLWAWLSLFWVGFTDVYIRLCAMGVWTDFHIFTL